MSKTIKDVDIYCICVRESERNWSMFPAQRLRAFHVNGDVWGHSQGMCMCLNCGRQQRNPDFYLLRQDNQGLRRASFPLNLQ